MNLILLTIAALSFGTSTKDTACIDWDNAKTFTIYRWPSGGKLNELRAGIDTMKGFEVDIHKVKEFLVPAKCEMQPMHMWQGYYLGRVFFLTGQPKILLVSSHGDVVYDVDARRFYSLVTERWTGWTKSLLKAQNMAAP
ncbi:hypothetical protein [Chitinophaga sp. sic0106]|uniref:hypothetical protein n=1 Tax=Chitinophaga sp. sic0106 TaxID=2854785 RepID=UPI001C496E4F|nr:hypothetical protein [Chitinophaga sp. sic0106]MBV7530996.1 hypothetical protein [Chitinophaga sp. sic0106]